MNTENKLKIDDFTKALAECIKQTQCVVVDPMAHAEIWEEELLELAKGKEPVSEDLEKAVDEYLSTYFGNEQEKQNWPFLKKMAMYFVAWQKQKDSIPVSEDLEDAVNAYIGYAPEVDESSSTYGKRQAFKAGAEWQKENLWKPADGDDLPIIDREVIVLIKYNTQRNIHDEEYPTYRVGFGHRPDPKGWEGKSVTTGKVEHYTPKTYDKGGWNIPDIVYWLDVELPKEVEL